MSRFSAFIMSASNSENSTNVASKVELFNKISTENDSNDAFGKFPPRKREKVAKISQLFTDSFSPSLSPKLKEHKLALNNAINSKKDSVSALVSFFEHKKQNCHYETHQNTATINIVAKTATVFQPTFAQVIKARLAIVKAPLNSNANLVQGKTVYKPAKANERFSAKCLLTDKVDIKQPEALIKESDSIADEEQKDETFINIVQKRILEINSAESKAAREKNCAYSQLKDKNDTLNFAQKKELSNMGIKTIVSDHKSVESTQKHDSYNHNIVGERLSQIKAALSKPSKQVAIAKVTRNTSGSFPNFVQRRAIDIDAAEASSKEIYDISAPKQAQRQLTVRKIPFTHNPLVQRHNFQIMFQPVMDELFAVIKKRNCIISLNSWN